MAEPPRGGALAWYMVAANYYTLGYLVAGACVVAVPALGPWARAGVAVAWLYLVPPVLGRLTLALLGRPQGEFTAEARAYRTWWLLTQLQMLYGRVALLEEALRIVPGAYSLWLRLWGSQVSLLVLWSPGVMITDRYLLRVARGVVVGTRSTLGAHIATVDARGEYRLTIAPIVLEEGSVVGALAGLGPGCHVFPRETVPAGRLLPPFSAWKDGRKVTAARQA